MSERSFPKAIGVRRWYGAPLLLLAVGAVSVVLLIGTQLLRKRLIDSDVARVACLSEIRTELTLAHLWVEEYVSGDDVPKAVVWRSLDEAKLGIEQLLGSAPDGATVVPRLLDSALVVPAERIRSLMQYFLDLSKHRYEGYSSGEPVGIGSEIDVEYDRVFDEIFRETEGIEAALSARLAQNYDRSRLLFQVILLAWIALIGLGFSALWSRERGRERAEEALRASQEQLLQAQKMDAIGRLAGGLAHDINNYLGAITSQCEVVRLRAGSDKPLSDRMEAVIVIAFKASGLIRQLLAFSRQQPTQLEVVDLNQVIADLDRMMGHLIGEDIEIDFQMAVDVWPVEVDTSQIEQVVVNLLVNAREAMPTGGTITIETTNCSKEQLDRTQASYGIGRDAVLMSVCDEGSGVDPEIFDRIFEPFFTTKGESHQGTGLGLSTVYGIVDRHGGRVWAENKPGGGARIALVLPRSIKKWSSAQDADKLLLPIPTEDPAHILLIEDNAELRESTAAILEALGYKVGIAKNGSQALAIFEDCRDEVAMIITDVVMPGMSGKEIADHLRARQPDLGVLFVSGYAGEVMSSHGFDSNQEAFLEKPFSAAQLAGKVEAVLLICKT